jgi:hypothetical protein
MPTQRTMLSRLLHRCRQNLCLSLCSFSSFCWTNIVPAMPFVCKECNCRPRRDGTCPTPSCTKFRASRRGYQGRRVFAKIAKKARTPTPCSKRPRMRLRTKTTVVTPGPPSNASSPPSASLTPGPHSTTPPPRTASLQTLTESSSSSSTSPPTSSVGSGLLTPGASPIRDQLWRDLVPVAAVVGEPTAVAMLATCLRAAPLFEPRVELAGAIWRFSFAFHERPDTPTDLPKCADCTSLQLCEVVQAVGRGVYDSTV